MATATDHIFSIDRWWNPVVDNQAMDCTYRIDRNHDGHVLSRFITHLYPRILLKKSLIARSMASFDASCAKVHETRSISTSLSTRVISSSTSDTRKGECTHELELAFRQVGHLGQGTEPTRA